MHPISKSSRALVSRRRSASSDRKKKLFVYLPVKVIRNSEDERKSAIQVSRNIVPTWLQWEFYARNLSALGYDQNVEKIIAAYAQVEAGQRRLRWMTK